MAATAEELIVAIRSEGVGETQEDLEGVEDSMEQTADSAGDSAENLEEFAQKFKGALSAAVAGLSVGIAGLASAVPVVGELFAGVAAVLQALAFQVDQLARDMGAGGLTAELFNLANSIYELDGALGDLVGALTAVGVAVVSALAGVTAWSIKTAGAAATASMFAGALKTAGASLAGFVSGSLAAAAAFGAFLGLLGVAVLEVTGLLDWVRNLGQALGSDLPGWANDALLALTSLFVGGLAVIGGAIAGFVSGVLDGGLSEGIDRAVANAQQVLSIFMGAWDRTIQRIREKVAGFIAWLQRKFDQDIAAGISVSDITGAVGDLGGGGGGGGGSGGGLSFRRGGGGGGGGTTLDGRQLTESTGRYRSDPGRRRGI